jgi:outer membrane receptor for ferric coprogen and ferric-rhodotorulic acid
VTRNLSGNELIFAPKFSGFLRAVYTQSLGRDIGTLTYNALANYTGRYFNDNANQFPQGGYTLLSAGLTWTAMSEKFNVGVFGNNLTGKEYTASIVPGSYGGFYQPAPPRTWGARFGFKFK